MEKVILQQQLIHLIKQAGFSIVKYTGTGTSGEGVPGLGVVPKP